MTSDTFVSCGRDDLFNSIKVWSWLDMVVFQVIKLELDKTVRAFSVSPDGTFLASGHDDGTIQVFSIDQSIAKKISLSPLISF